MQTEDTLKEEGTCSWEWLTGEVLIYAGICLFSLVVHLAWLGFYPLRAAEAASALAAWRILHPGLPLPSAWSPLLVSADLASFGILQASDFTARLLPALVGISLPILPWFWRRQLGRIGAIAAAVILAISPAFLMFSRQADGVLLAGTLCAWSLTAGWQALAHHWSPGVTASAVLLGLALTAAPNTYTWLVSLVILGSLYYGRSTPLRRSELRLLFKPFASSRFWLALAASFLVGATAFLTNLGGLSQAVELPWRWLNGVTALQNPFGWDGIARNLVVYEPLVLALALGGAVVLAPHNPRGALWLSGWFLLSALLSWLFSAGNPSWITDMLWPLVILAAFGTQWLWGELTRNSRLDWIVLAALTALTGTAFLYLLEYVRVPDNSLLAYGGTCFALVILGWLGYRLWHEHAAARRVAILLIVALLLFYTIRADSALLYQTGSDPRESYVAQPSSLALRSVDTFIASNASHLWRDAHAASISYPPELDPILGWTLRDYKTALLDDGLVNTSDVLILPYQPGSSGPSGYVGQHFILRQQYLFSPLSLQDGMGWLLLRRQFGVLESEQIEVWLAVTQSTIQP